MVLRVGEFFSGIGAMHLALDELALAGPQNDQKTVAIAFDINQVANATYCHNFGLQPVTKLIEHCPALFFEDLALNAWLLSPPCQPFTRGGKMRDHLDERSIGLLHLISVLRVMRNPPEYIFLENVLNFEVSECRRQLVETLESRRYYCEEYLVSPTDACIGIPNDRLRYYLIAKLSTATVPPRRAQNDGKIITSLSQVCAVDPLKTVNKISEYLLPETEAASSLLVPHRYIVDYKNYRHDIVHPGSQRSTTFTKAYGSDYIIGTGSFLQTLRLDLAENPKDDPEVLLTLGLRFFHPKEIARLHAFPENFEFAPGTTRIQQYRLLGNSMNVRVVSVLLNRLFNEL